MKVVAYDARGERLQDRGPPRGAFEARVPVVVSDLHPGRFVATVRAALDAGALPLLLPAGTPRERALALAKTLRASALVFAEGLEDAEITPLEGRPLAVDEPAFLACTSGSTTDEPTTYLVSLARARANARAHLASLGLHDSRGGRILMPLPLAHSFGFVAGVLAAEALGAELHATTQLPLPAVLFQLVAREAITALHTTPTHVRAFERTKLPANGHETPALRVVSIGSSTVTRSDARELARHFPSAARFASYGLTECGPRVATLDLATLDRNGSEPLPIGRAIEGVVLGTSEPGAGADPELVVTTAYLALARVTRDGLHPLDAGVPFPTADRVRQDADSFVLLGRSDGVIVRGGTNVYPRTLEAVAERVAGVRAACAVPRRSTLYGDVPVLVVEPDEAADQDGLMLAIEEACAAQLSVVERPVAIRFVKALPQTSLGKIRRGLVTDAYGGPSV